MYAQCSMYAQCIICNDDEDFDKDNDNKHYYDDDYYDKDVDKGNDKNGDS